MQRSSLEPYGFAVLSVAAALLLKLFVDPFLQPHPAYLLFYVPIMASAWRGGFGPGLLATLLSALASDFLFLNPRDPLARPMPSQDLGLLLFGLEGLLISVLTATKHRAERGLREQDRGRVEAELRSRADEMRAVLDSALDAVIGMDATGAVTSWNPRAAEIFGWSAREAVGRNLAELVIPPTERETHRRALLRFLEGGKGTVVGQRVEMRALRRDRSHFPVEISLHARRQGGTWTFNAFVADITERKHGEELLRRQLAFTRAITENLGEGVFVLDDSGRFTLLNTAALGMLAGEAAELNGRPLHDIVHAGRAEPEGSCPLLAAVRADVTTHVVDDVFVRRDGTSFPVSYTASPIPADGHPAGSVLVFHDISGQRQIEESRVLLLAREQEARRVAETANRLKDEFLATLSHELRTPLTAMVGWAHILRTGNLEPKEAARAIESIDRNAKAQAQIISDILDVSRIITGKLRLELRPLALGPVLEAALDTVRPSADAKGVSLSCPPAKEEIRVSADADRLQQVIWNLLANAIKFTPKGGAVRVRLLRARGQGQIVVEDTGPGIRPEFLPHVFERFRQADSSSTRPHGGLGLGLAIVRHLIELHGGTVDAASAGPGKGATFTVKLPLARQTEAAPPATAPDRRAREGEAPVPDALRLEGMYVLTVDDDPDTRDLVETVLKRCGARVSTADSAAQAMEHIARERPDVLLADIEMPGRDGLSLIREIRALGPAGGDIPAAAVTAYARDEDRARALLAGFQVHLAKPIQPDELVAVVASLSGRAAGASAESATDRPS